MIFPVSVIFPKNPALYLGLIGAALSLAVSFGLKVSGEQVTLIMAFASALITLLVGVAIRTQVYPRESVQLALDQKSGTSVDEFDKQLASKE